MGWEASTRNEWWESNFRKTFMGSQKIKRLVSGLWSHLISANMILRLSLNCSLFLINQMKSLFSKKLINYDSNHILATSFLLVWLASNAPKTKYSSVSRLLMHWHLKRQEHSLLPLLNLDVKQALWIKGFKFQYDLYRESECEGRFLVLL